MAFKRSKQRDLIIDFMDQDVGHVSAEEIFDGINQGDDKISLATVYRNLGILEEMNEIKKIALTDEGFVYDRKSSPHYHFYCDQCHTLYDLDLDYDRSLENILQNNSVVGTVHAHEMTFRGICKNCKKT